MAQGDACDLSTMNGATPAREPLVTDETTRYAKGKTAFCTGDSRHGHPRGRRQRLGATRRRKVTTIINVYEPSTTPWQPLDAPLICSVTLNGWDDTAELARALNQVAATTTTLAQYFRRWQTICRVNGAKLGDYTVQIRTVGGWRPEPLRDAGRRRGCIEAGLDVRQGKTSFFNSVPAGTSVFYLARLDSGAAGKILDVDFFDLADADDPVNVTVLQPDSDTPFSTCAQVGAADLDSDAGTPISNCTIKHDQRRQQRPVGPDQRVRPGDLHLQQRRRRLASAGCACGSTPQPGRTTRRRGRASLEGDPVRIVE